MFKYSAVLAFQVLVPKVSSACVFAALPSIEQLYAETDVIFVGELISSRRQIFQEPSSDQSNLIYQGSSPLLSAWRVLEVLKSDLQSPNVLVEGEVVYILQDLTSCNLGATVNEEYLIFGTKVLSRTYTTSLASGSSHMSNAAKKIDELRAISQ